MKLKLGFALTGSFCTFSEMLPVIEGLVKEFDVIPIMSFNASSLDTRFGKAEYFKSEIEKITGNKILDTIQKVEPIGPKGMLDIIIVSPCTGNSLNKIAAGISDTPVTLAVKSHLRNQKPVVIAISTNDGLSGSAKSLGELLNRKHIFFTPFRQDDFLNKPNSLVADFKENLRAIKSAEENKQIQPILLRD